MSSIQTYSDETMLSPDPPASSKSSPGSKVTQFWVDPHWHFLELSLPWLIPHSFGWALTRLHQSWCTSLWMRRCNSWLEWQWQKTEPTWASLVLGGAARIREVQDPSDDPRVQADPDQYGFPLKITLLRCLSRDFWPLQAWKLQYFSSSSCWDGNKRGKSWIWLFWFPRP